MTSALFAILSIILILTAIIMAFIAFTSIFACYIYLSNDIIKYLKQKLFNKKSTK